MKCASVLSAYRNCILRASVWIGRNFSPALNVRSITAPSAARRSFVRTNAPPLPGFTCWYSMILKTVPSTSMWLPFLNWLVEIVGISPSSHKSLVRPKSLARMAVVLGLVAVPEASAAPPWTAPVIIGGTGAPPRVEANEIDQSVLVPRMSAGKELAAPQLVQWRGAEDGRVLVALNGTHTIRVRTSSVNVASSRYAGSRILHLDARVVD